MPLIFEQTTSTHLPLDATGLVPDKICGLSVSEIAKLEMGFGNGSALVGDVFKLSGSPKDYEIRFEGDLENVHSIGAQMASGIITAAGDTGRHVGAAMTGGLLKVDGNASDYAGFEMKGGLLHVLGNAGNHVGGCFPGAPFGMNRGTICVSGDVGKGLGYRMRRGTIAVGGDAGELVGWQMRAGTIMLHGNCKGRIGVDMKRGTIITGSSQSDIELALGATFQKGMRGFFPIVGMLQRWLRDHAEKFNLPFEDCTKSTDNSRPDSYTTWHGDVLAGGRGEVFSFSE
jgi:formylmethanofuran dehydrogenase subunit C